ncbi:MAG: hypothetical protein C4576_09145 [Desulfobacteraceae bacterium]|nr:MAG: hypothetical protein C4576_09145 [Desulfobacteraceae bacterium]
MTEKIPGGFIILARKLLHSEIIEKPPLFLKLFIWMLLQASHKDHGDLKRGQFFTSLAKIQKAMAHKVGYRTVKPTIKEIRGITKYLMKVHMVVTMKVTHGLIITILNYDLYQDWENYEGHNEGHHEGSSRGTIPTKKGNKEGKNKGELPFSSEISLLKQRYSDPEIIDRCLDAIRTTRKTGKVSDSVILSILQGWEKYPVDRIQEGIRLYLDKDYAGQGKNEKYLLGIIRNLNGKGPNEQGQSEGFKFSGSSLLDRATRENWTPTEAGE